MQKGQAERLMPMLQEMLTEAHCTWADLHRIGVGIGPGNFTGIRLSVSAARGLALGLGIPAIGVNSFDTLALHSDGPVLIAIDARGGRVYLQLFGRDVFPDIEPCLIALDDLPSALFGISLKVVGSAAEVVAEKIGGTAGPAHYYPASAIARIAAVVDLSNLERPAPYYMRDPDAAPPREAPPKIIA